MRKWLEDLKVLIKIISMKRRKDSDQLHVNYADDLCLCFRIFKNGFSHHAAQIVSSYNKLKIQHISMISLLHSKILPECVSCLIYKLFSRITEYDMLEIIYGIS